MAKDRTDKTATEAASDHDSAIHELREQVAALTARLNGHLSPKPAGPVAEKMKADVARGKSHVTAEQVLALFAEAA